MGEGQPQVVLGQPPLHLAVHAGIPEGAHQNVARDAYMQANPQALLAVTGRYWTCAASQIAFDSCIHSPLSCAKDASAMPCQDEKLSCAVAAVASARNKSKSLLGKNEQVNHKVYCLRCCLVQEGLPANGKLGEPPMKARRPRLASRLQMVEGRGGNRHAGLTGTFR